MAKDRPTRQIFHYGVRTARQFWDVMVEPDITDFEVNPSPRSAFHVAQSLWAVKEWIEEEVGEAIEPPASCLLLLQDVAESGKHRAVFTEKEGRPREAHMFSQMVQIGFYYDVNGSYGGPEHSPPVVWPSRFPSVITKDAKQVPFDNVIREAAVILKARLPPAGRE